MSSSVLRRPLTCLVSAACLLPVLATTAHAATYYTQQGKSQTSGNWGVCVYQEGGNGQIAGVQMNLSWEPACMKAASGNSCKSNTQSTKPVHSTTKGDGTLKAIYLSFSDTDPIPDGLLFCCDFQLTSAAGPNGCQISISELIGSSGAGQRMPVQASMPRGSSGSGGAVAQAPAVSGGGDTGSMGGGGDVGGGSTGGVPAGSGSSGGAASGGVAPGHVFGGGTTGVPAGGGNAAGGTASGGAAVGGGTGSIGSGSNAGAQGGGTAGHAPPQPGAEDQGEEDEGAPAAAGGGSAPQAASAATATPKPPATATARPVLSPTKTKVPEPTETPKSGLGGCQLIPR